MLLPLLVSLVLSSPPSVPDAGITQVACQTVADCWLDEDARPIPRPKKFRGKPVPRGDCGSKLLWLRNLLSCEEGVCRVKFIGDKC